MKSLYTANKEIRLKGKWIQYTSILPLLNKYKSVFKIEEIGLSYLKLPIHTITLGSGPTKVLMWSQMHGNEATATKVIFDLLNLFNSKDIPDKIAAILEQCTVMIIPILNPDGAKAYTRVNAQQIDLNRDAVALEAVESQLLRQTLNSFKPHYCFNLHDQRNIYSVGKTQEPATISFLAPSTEITRKITPERLKAMAVIVEMYKALYADIPKNISRYNDEFYPNATGDNFQKEGYCTILIEAGHFLDDYNREQVRYFYFKALLTGLRVIASKNQIDKEENYNKIPENDSLYLDCIFNNVNLLQEGLYQNVSVGILFLEEIKNNKLTRVPSIEKIGCLANYGANTVKNLKGIKISSVNELFRLLY
ncbi:MAG: zinc carboxypeptidase [Flavobacteriaceae bacterium]|nr:zinc carboxypeptidase [Flavobacteriaceae bacterium]